MQLVSEQRTFGRGLLFHEVAIIKRMRLMEHPRDYIFSFILRPGRKLTPACLSEVENGQIGADVEPATGKEVASFIARRLSEVAEQTDLYGPLSSFQISQALGWFSRAQNDLFRDESQEVEVKIFPKVELEAMLGYVKTMAAFSNNTGCYLFFGISDERQPVGVPDEELTKFGSDRLATLCREHFQPNINWDRRLFTWMGKTPGVIYTFEADRKPTVAAKDGKGVSRSAIYYRYRGHTEVIALGDLFKMLEARDEKTRVSAISSIARIA